MAIPRAIQSKMKAYTPFYQSVWKACAQIPKADGRVTCPEGQQARRRTCPQGQQACPEGQQARRRTCPEGQQACPQGQQACLQGQQACPQGQQARRAREVAPGGESTA